MGQKTILRFSKNILKHLPDMAINSVEAAQGNIVSWMNVGERIVRAMGDTVTFCIEHNNIKKIANEFQQQKEEAKQDLDKMEAELLHKSKDQLEKIHRSIQKEQEELDEHIRQVRLETKRIRESEIPYDKIDQEINQMIDNKIEIMEKRAEIQKKKQEKNAQLYQEKLEKETQEKEFLNECKSVFRGYLNDAIIIFNDKLSKCTALKKLPEEKQVQIDEQYRMLVWQYNKEIDI